MGDVVFIEGVPSSGKTSVARELGKRVSELKVIHGDELVRKWGRRRSFTPAFAREMFGRLLDRVDATSAESDVVVDMTIPASYLTDAITRFPDAVFVSLRISESERRAREHKRKRKRPFNWDDEIAATQAPEDAFALILNTDARSPAECAESILEYFDNDEEP
jgi:chloramphenicol 3-O-phosphotransferase